MIDPIELHAWADGEIAQDREAAVRRALADSREAKAELDAIVALKFVLRTKLPAVPSDPQWRACVLRLNELDRTHRVERLVSGRFAWGLSTVFFAAIIVAGLMHRGVDSSNVNSADVARMLGTFAPMPRATTSEATSAAVNDLLNKAKISVDPHRLDVLGRDYGELDGRAATRYVLRDASGLMNLVIVPDVLQIDETGEIRRDHTFSLLRLGSLNGVAWTNGRGTLILVGDRPYEDLTTVASGFH